MLMRLGIWPTVLIIAPYILYCQVAKVKFYEPLPPRPADGLKPWPY